MSDWPFAVRSVSKYLLTNSRWVFKNGRCQRIGFGWCIAWPMSPKLITLSVSVSGFSFMFVNFTKSGTLESWSLLQRNFKISIMVSTSKYCAAWPISVLKFPVNALAATLGFRMVSIKFFTLWRRTVSFSRSLTRFITSVWSVPEEESWHASWPRVFEWLKPSLIYSPRSFKVNVFVQTMPAVTATSLLRTSLPSITAGLPSPCAAASGDACSGSRCLDAFGVHEDARDFAFAFGVDDLFPFDFVFVPALPRSMLRSSVEASESEPLSSESFVSESDPSESSTELFDSRSSCHSDVSG